MIIIIITVLGQLKKQRLEERKSKSVCGQKEKFPVMVLLAELAGCPINSASKLLTE